METTAAFGIGLDQGVGSIGWAILRLDLTGQPVKIERLGVHLFEAGTEGDISAGRDESRAGPRRQARQLRRQYRRRVLRKRRLLRWLQELGLMPPGDITTPEGRDGLLRSLDASLRAKWEALPSVSHRERQLLPYRLRAAGLTQRLERFELGRALYHLAQRRGYLSNRRLQSQLGGEVSGKKDGKKDDDSGVVRASIIELQRQMQGAGSATLAQYFSTLDPSGTIGERLRGRWTAREMFLEEFNRICDEQSKHYPALTDDARRKLHREIFFQRPLKSAAGLIGECELCPGRRRAPMAHRLAQRFRLLQRVNDLLIELPDFTSRPLTRDERDRLLAALERDGDIAFAKLKQKKWFGLPSGSRFNLEGGEKKKLIGHRTDAKCRAVFGDDRWDAMPDSERDAVVQDLIVFEKPSALMRRGMRKWGLDEERAHFFADCVLEPGYAAHSLAALKILVARMEDGTPYATARKEEFGTGDAPAEAHDLLPPVEDALGSLRNPAVTRALTELRKLMNAILRRYGKPAWIRLELARDLKRARKHRERMSGEMRAQEDRRNEARARILTETGISQVGRADIERVLLAEECGWICPYTGKPFGMSEIVGRHPQVDVEHIWPLSRSLDDSFLNKTLCFVDENRNVKKNRTPFEAYARAPERWEQMLDRVRRFRSDAARIKMERFSAAAIPDGFAERHLAETRKIGAASAGYLGLLFGGECDPSGRRRVFVTTGGLTAHLRREWHLNGLLSLDGEKTRDDHRHHAIDALVVALTDTRAVQLLQRAAEQASASGRRLFAPVDDPWPGFVDEARSFVELINVSYRQSRKVSGKLHAETNYSRPIGPDGRHRIRKELAELTENDVACIVDPKVKAAVETRIRELGLKPKGQHRKYTDFADRGLHPFTVTKAGAKNWIHKVRIATGEKPWAVGSGARNRFVKSTPGSNHHAVLRKQRDGKWADTLVPLLTAGQSDGNAKLAAGGDEFTLAAGEFVTLKDSRGADHLYRVLSLSSGDIELIEHTDARLARDRKNERTRGGAASLMNRGLKKVSVTYLGEIRRAGG